MSLKSAVSTPFATIRALTSTRGRRADESVERLASALAASGESGTVQITLRGGKKPQHFSIEVGRDRVTSKARQLAEPDLEIVIQESTWWEIAEGRLSPPEAFRRGKMRLRGDINLGSRLYKAVAADDGSTDICFG